MGIEDALKRSVTPEAQRMAAAVLLPKSGSADTVGIRVPISTGDRVEKVKPEPTINSKAEKGAWDRIKDAGTAAKERVLTSLDNASDRFIASNSVRGLGGQIDGLKRQIETFDKDALAADARGDRTQTIALRTKLMEALASIDTKAKERSAFAGKLQAHYENKLSAPVEERKKWGEEFDRKNNEYKTYESINSGRRTLFEKSNVRFSALVKSGIPQDSEDMKKVFAQLRTLDEHMQKGEEAMGLAKKQMDEHADKIGKWDSENKKVMIKVNRWKNVAENGKHGTSVETLSRQGAIDAAQNVTALPSREAPSLTKNPEARGSAAPQEAAPATTEVPERLSDEELINVLAEILNQPEEFDFDKELKKLIDSDLGKFVEMARPKGNLVDTWNRLAKADRQQYEPITDKQRKGSMSLVDFARELNNKLLKKKPEMVIAGITMMARALKKNPGSLAA